MECGLRRRHLAKLLSIESDRRRVLQGRATAHRDSCRTWPGVSSEGSRQAVLESALDRC